MMDPKTKIICLYHAECTDGAGAAAAVAYKYPQAECVPMKHGEPVTVDVTGAIVYVVDFSFPVEVFKKIIASAKEVHWYDHHKTALEIQAALGGIGDLVLEESGASLTWKKLFPDKSVPPIIAYIRDKDLWLWQLPGSRAISTSMYDIPEVMNPKDPLWADLLNRSGEGLNELRIDGEKSLKRQRLEIEKGCKRGFEINFHGHRAFAVNWTSEASSIGEYIYKDLGYEVAITFYYDGKFWKCSLRSNCVDVSELAQKYGGGGHSGAAGFRVSDIGWLFAAILSTGIN